MKLNPSAFRRGNLVKYDNRVFEIDTISEEFPTLNTAEFGIGVVDWNNLEPYRIKRDNLVVRNFKEAYKTECWIKYEHEIDPGLCYHFLNILGGLNFLSYDGVNITCDYFHEMQNIYFALVRKEIELK